MVEFNKIFFATVVSIWKKSKFVVWENTCGIKDDLDDQKIVRPYIVNSVVEGSYY